jgi:hypothetical protein
MTLNKISNDPGWAEPNGTGSNRLEPAKTRLATSVLLRCFHPGLHHVHNVIAHRIEHEVTDRVQL